MGQKPKKSTWKKAFDWAILLLMLMVIFSSETRSQLQRLMLYTGIFNPNTNTEATENASYQFTLVSSEGQTLNFEDLKGKVVFMNLWATWCPPCVAEMPDIHELYKQIASEDIAFVMLSMDDDPEKVKSFIEKKQYTFPVYFPKSPVPTVYNTKSIPTTFVISPQGKIVSKNYGMANYNNNSFKNFLNELKP